MPVPKNEFHVAAFYSDCYLKKVGDKVPTIDHNKVIVRSRRWKEFMNSCQHFMSLEVLGFWVNTQDGSMAEVTRVSITDQRAYHVYKLKGDTWELEVLENQYEEYCKQKREAWARYDKWLDGQEILGK